MTRLITVLVWLVGAAPAIAQEATTFPEMTGPLQAHADAETLAALPADATDPVTRGARQLSMQPTFIQLARQGLDLLYHRRYRETRRFFAAMEQVYPGTAVASIADMLVWQAVMLENFDFRHDAQYQAASAAAASKLTAAMEQPGNEAWEHFMMAGVVGLESIHAARQGRYLPALTLAFKAIDQVERTRSAAPTFVDLQLADGLYNYWRTVISEKSKALPNFGDRKAEGIRQVQQVADAGIFLGPPGHLAMAFTWLEERDYDKAIAACEVNRASYPDSVINTQMLGISQLYARRYAEALASFDHVLAVDPGNARVRYYKGLAYFRADQVDLAGKEFEAYLTADHLEDYQRAAAEYRLGRVRERQERLDDAEALYKAAIKTNGDDRAKRALDVLRKARKGG